MIDVAVLALPGVHPFELSIPARVFGAAERRGRPAYHVRTATLDGRPVATSADFRIAVEHDAALLRQADLIVLAPGRYTAPTEVGRLAQLLGPHLAARRRSSRVMSICTAAYLLAELGLLDGRTAVTHWGSAADLAGRYPEVTVDADSLFLRDGAVLTSAGVAAGIDLCLDVIRQDLGARAAAAVARACVVAPLREGGQRQFVDQPVPERHDTSTGPTLAWMSANLGEPIGLADMAAHAHMSARTFSRRFRQEHGVPPGAWLTRARVHHAKVLLEATAMPVERIAREVGLGTAANLRTHLARCAKTTPSGYRRTFSQT